MPCAAILNLILMITARAIRPRPTDIITSISFSSARRLGFILGANLAGNAEKLDFLLWDPSSNMAENSSVFCSEHLTPGLCQFSCVSNGASRGHRRVYHTASLFSYQARITSIVVRYSRSHTTDLDNPLQCDAVEISMYVTEPGRLENLYKECVLE